MEQAAAFGWQCFGFGLGATTALFAAAPTFKASTGSTNGTQDQLGLGWLIWYPITIAITVFVVFIAGFLGGFIAYLLFRKLRAPGLLVGLIGYAALLIPILALWKLAS